MKIIDSGHAFALDRYDREPKDNYQPVYLVFMKREGENYPGNHGHHSGTNMQEVLRALISRTLYLNTQKAHWINPVCVFLYRISINLLEYRAARQHRRPFRFILRIEKQPTNSINGHVYYA